MKAGWEVRSIASFAKTGAGGTPKKSTKEFYEGGEIPWLLSGEVANANITEAKNFITVEGLKGSSAKRFPADSVLVAMYGATAGEVGVLRFEAATNQAVCAVLPSEQHIPEYLYYYLLHAKPALVAQAVGNAQPNISQAKIKSLEIPLPPLEEQQRIVAVLDEAFDGLARARAHAEANLQNARELFDNSLEAELALVGNSNEARLGDNIDLLAGFAFKSAGYTDSQDAMRLIRGDNIVPGAVRWEGAKYWPLENCAGHEKYQLQPDDILIAMDRTWIKAGVKFAVLTESDVPSLLVQRVARLRCTASLNTQFLAMLIGSKSFERYVLSIQTGTGVPHISPTQIKDFAFPLPAIAAQTEMVGRFLRIRDGCTDLSNTYSMKIQGIDDLRQSLLQKAFAGELT